MNTIMSTGMSTGMITIEEQVFFLSHNFTQIINRNELHNYPNLNWGQNGIGDRWANKKFNYTVIYGNKRIKNYCENIETNVPEHLIENFFLVNTFDNKKNSVVGIFVHSKRENNDTRPIRSDISRAIVSKNCVVCGSNSSIVCDHKNDLYNDRRVLCAKTQDLSDFQPLCNHCNLQKRQICKDEIINGVIYSAKNIQRYKMYRFEFPWEKKVFDTSDINCKNDTYWYDPVEFDNKIYCYSMYTLPLIFELKRWVKQGKIPLRE